MENKQKKKSKLFLIITLAVVCFCLIIVLAGALFIKSKLDKIQYSDGSREQTLADPGIPEDEEETIDISDLTLVEDVPTPEGDVLSEDGILNVLLLGTDERSDELSESARSDCMMLLSLNMNDNTGKLISLERGMGVVMLGGMYEGKVDLLTHCFRWGGAELVLKEVQEYFKVDVEKYVRVNFAALAKLVNVIGGVDIDLTYQEAVYLNGVASSASERGYSTQYFLFDEEQPQRDFVEGTNHLYGSAALAYSRIRKIDSDWTRIERQRNVVQACINKAKEMDLLTLNTLCDELLPMVQTNFTQKEIALLLLEVPNFAGVKFDQLTIPVDRDTMGGVARFSGGGAYAPDYELNARVIQEFIYGEAK